MQTLTVRLGLGTSVTLRLDFGFGASSRLLALGHSNETIIQADSRIGRKAANVSQGEVLSGNRLT